MSAETIQLQMRADSTFVDASLLDGMSPPDLLVVEAEWLTERSLVMQELLRSAVPRSAWPQSIHWDWRRKAPELELLESSGFGIVIESRWQGVMLTKSASHFATLAPDKGKPLVYIDYLEVAPWNWRIPEIARAGRYRGIGPTLFWRAVRQSADEGFQGRVGLHSLPQAEAFYMKCGMTRLGPDPGKQNLTYYELSSKQGMSLLKQGEAP